MRRKFATLTSLLTLLITAAMPTYAEPTRNNSLMISTLALGYGVAELRWERALEESWALIAIVGGGPGLFLAPEPGLWLGEFGGQLRKYAIGDRDEGIAIAVECVASRLYGDTAGGRSGVAFAGKWAFKKATEVGFTVELQVGGAVVSRWATPTGYASSDAKPIGEATINACIGWTF